MAGMAENLWDEHAAATYRATSADKYAPEVLDPTVDFLSDLAGDGPALEFAIGTGRVGIALAARGIPVHGLELSEAMVDQLRREPGGADLPVTIGDMATTRVPGEFSLVYLVFNTITNLLTQDEQVDCFGNAAAHLRPGGRFVIEVLLPDLQRLPPGQSAVPFHIGQDHLGFDEYDLLGQRLVSHHYWTDRGQIRTARSPHRYAWPAEYDLMARIAGLKLEARWADWDRSEFTAASRNHVSVWRLPESG